MKYVVTLLAGLLATVGPLSAQATAPPEVTKSAIDAVEELGKQVVLGNHKVAVDKMYPAWKKRMAIRVGGIDKLEAKLLGIGQLMARNGVNMISFKTKGAPWVYEVWPAAEDDKGAPVFSKWVMLIPTVTTFRIMEGDPPKAHIINSHGFQVAVSGKDKLDWTFINGSDITVPDLRALFPSLPANLELPNVKREAVE